MAGFRSIANRMSINRAVRRAPEFATENEAFDLTHSDEETPLGEVLKSETRKQVRAGLKRLASSIARHSKRFTFVVSRWSKWRSSLMLRLEPSSVVCTLHVSVWPKSCPS